MRTGKTLALELKTTEAHGVDHVLEIDTYQLTRYLNPPSGPPLPVYYVFPTPHWTGPLTSRSGTAPSAPTGSAATPPEWWRRRVGRGLVRRLAPRDVCALRGRCVAAGLERTASEAGEVVHPERFSSARRGAGLGGPTRSAFSLWPMNWARFWKVVTHCGPNDGVRWRTFAGDDNRPERVLVLDADQEREWPIGELLDQSWRQLGPERRRTADIVVEAGEGIGGNERLLLHIPEAALR